MRHFVAREHGSIAQIIATKGHDPYVPGEHAVEIVGDYNQLILGSYYNGDIRPHICSTHPDIQDFPTLQVLICGLLDQHGSIITQVNAESNHEDNVTMIWRLAPSK
jgi:hypothetical protein